jgi:CheY-like chemotaxis protein
MPERILLVDDEESIREIIASMLVTAGYSSTSTMMVSKPNSSMACLKTVSSAPGSLGTSAVRTRVARL